MSNFDTSRGSRMTRRGMLVGAGAAVVGGLGACWVRDGDERGRRAEVFIAKAGSYDQDLTVLLREALGELGIGRSWAARQSILLKPNLVEPCRDAPQITTHSAVVRAAVEVFRSWDASEVIVAEGPGHCRDIDYVLEESCFDRMLAETRVEFVDLNHDDVDLAKNRLGLTRLDRLYLPSTLRRVDRVVSLPKLKTHHWTGVTLSLKNLFGIMPGRIYGWPKNVFHREGIGRSILDVAATVAPDLTIIDGIVGMEGDGPIMGSPKKLGALIVGTDLVAADATATRLMGFDPVRVEYLREASGRLGPILEKHIAQRGEPLASSSRPFALLDHPAFPKIRARKLAIS